MQVPVNFKTNMIFENNGTSEDFRVRGGPEEVGNFDEIKISGKSGTSQKIAGTKKFKEKNTIFEKAAHPTKIGGPEDVRNLGKS